MGNVLTWKDVDFNPVNTGGGRDGGALLALNDGLSGLQEGIREWEKRGMNRAAVEGQAEMMRITSPEEWAAAAEAGLLRIAPGNEEFAQKRQAELLEHVNKGLVNTGQEIKNRTDENTLFETKDTFADAEAMEAAKVEIQPLVARVAQLSNMNTPESRAEAEQLVIDNAELFGRAGLDASTGVNGILTGQTNERVRQEAQDKFDWDLQQRDAKQSAAPIQAEIARLTDLGTLQGKKDALALAQQNATLFEVAGIETETLMAGLADAVAAAAPGTEKIEGAVDAAEDAEKLRTDVDKSNARFEEILNTRPYVNMADADAAIDKMDDLSFEAKQLLKARLQEPAASETLFPMPDIVAAQEERERTEKAGITGPSSVPGPVPQTLEELEASLRGQSGAAPSPSQTAAFQELGKQWNTEADETLRVGAVSDAISGNASAVLQAFESPERPIDERDDAIRAAFESGKPKELDADAEEAWSKSQSHFEAEVKRIEERWHVRWDVALKLAQGAVSDSAVWEVWEDNQKVNQETVDEYVESVIGKADASPAEKVSTTLDLIRLQNAKALGAENLARLQKGYNDAMTQLYGIMDGGSPEAIKKAEQRTLDLGKRYSAELARVRGSQATTAGFTQ